MIYLAIGIAALIAMRLIRHCTAGAIALAAPMILIGLHAWSRSALSAIGVWLAAAVTLAILWKGDRG